MYGEGARPLIKPEDLTSEVGAGWCLGDGAGSMPFAFVQERPRTAGCLAYRPGCVGLGLGFTFERNIVGPLPYWYCHV